MDAGSVTPLGARIMVQAAHLRKRDNATDFRPLDWPRLRVILLRSTVRLALVMIRHKATEVAPQEAFTQDDDMIGHSAPIVPITRSM